MRAQVEHEDTPGFAPTKDGVLEFFRVLRAAFPDLRMTVEGMGQERSGWVEVLSRPR